MESEPDDYGEESDEEVQVKGKKNKGLGSGLASYEDFEHLLDSNADDLEVKRTHNKYLKKRSYQTRGGDTGGYRGKKRRRV